MAELLTELSDLNGVSGSEKHVRDFIISRIRPYADEIRVDAIGSIIAFKKGSNGGKTLLLLTNMDEVGCIISDITEDGFLKFKTVGDFDTRNIISKCVKINASSSVSNDGTDGIIGMKAIHLQKKEEREATAVAKDLYIDIGAKSKKGAQKRVRLGDYVSFSTKAFRLGNKICGKALDSRAGCACMIELMKEEYENDIYFVFASQREIGMRGAQCAAHGIKADRALIIESAESADMHGVKKEETAAKIGEGVCVNFMDKYAICDKTLTESYLAELKKERVKVQVRQNVQGLTDTGGVQLCTEGTATACLTLPVRYAHTPSCIISEEDVKALGQAANVFIRKAGKKF